MTIMMELRGLKRNGIQPHRMVRSSVERDPAVHGLPWGRSTRGRPWRERRRSFADAIQQVYNQRVLGLYGMWSGSGDLASWLTEALNLTGQPLSLLQGLMYAAMSESGGNPNAENDWDSNAAAGTPSIGLLKPSSRLLTLTSSRGMTTSEIPWTTPSRPSGT